MRKWDVAILGANAGGILAGALLTKKGFSVLVVEKKAKADCFYGEHRFRRFSNLSELLVSKATVKGVYHLLGLPLAYGEFGHRGDVRCQIILPGHRVDLWTNRTDLLDEMRREFPGNFGLIESLYSRLQGEDWVRRTTLALGDEQPQRGRIARWLAHVYQGLSDRPLSTFLGPLREDKAFARFIDVQVTCMSYLLMGDSPLSLACHLLGILVQDEVFTDMVGTQGFMDRIKEEMVRGGGQIIALESFDTIHIEKSPEGFRIYTEEGEPITSKVCIGAIPFTYLRKLIPAAFTGKKWTEKGKGLWPKYSILSLNLGIDARGVPVGLGDCFASLHDLDAPYENGNLLMVLMGPKGVGVPPAKRAATINAFVPGATGRPARDGIKGIIGNILIHLLEVAPFLDRSIELIDGQPSVERHCSDWINNDIVYEGTSSFRVGDEILPIITPLEGLFLACRENLPYLGFEGEILSGIRAAEAIVDRFA